MNKGTNSLNLHGIHLKENKHMEGGTVQKHHHQIYQILYVLKDEGKVTLNEKEFDFNQDNVAFITPFSNHSIVANSKMTVLTLEFEVNDLDTEFQEEIINNYFDFSQLIELNLFQAGEIRQLLRKMLYEQSLGNPINRLGMKIYLSELLLILANSQEEPKMLDANTLRAERLRKYIDTHYFEMINTRDISMKLGMSMRHINHIFKEQYNITPIQYLTEVRLELTKKMLLETDKDIASICFEVGFESLATFYRTFKNYTNLSPNRFRAQYKSL
ncbi:AraC-like DNA-binding protein [Virgibacillus natechei]|uniref:AraC-like DNA-binding protein n=1 Tax=Virgibacillus natechei TaxID=1216297 RepID=A0ABS4IE72_9BACI|nr:AraC family transcriptional regulator [Virgibacillus natechei]MBP1969242.1 AraC-like DNA-binding protein [Virgibacillus natechei]UZD12403.1 AraC family transcriptional regulator [Virgibacillus natechei]